MASGSRQIQIIIAVFVFSRLAAHFAGLQLSLWPLYAYWQYLDLETLKHHLLTGIWYDHAQPPAFNLFLGLVLKVGGNHSALLFTVLLKLVSLANGLLLFSILKKLVTTAYIPLIVALIYLLSPATLVFECELFYTTVISCLLLISVFALVEFVFSGKENYVWGIFLPLALLCLTRSVYHIFWLLILSVSLLIFFRKSAAYAKLLQASLVALMVVGGWYVKNKLIFGQFTTSSWLGMNMARNVFHDNAVSDSSRIETYEPFSKISVYGKFLDPRFEIPFQGLNDLDLLQEMKNDSFINARQVSYIRVSQLYQNASTQYIRTHPVAYLKNILQSTILYFTPATVYSLVLKQTAKIRTYDLLYSFNLTHFSHDKQQRRLLLTISAFPKMFIYMLVFFTLIRLCIQNRSITAWNLMIVLTMGFVFGVSSLFEHYENMRFRFETEPLFLILAGQVLSRWYSRWQIRRKIPSRDLIA